MTMMQHSLPEEKTSPVAVSFDHPFVLRLLPAWWLPCKDLASSCCIVSAGGTKRKRNTQSVIQSVSLTILNTPPRHLFHLQISVSEMGKCTLTMVNNFFEQLLWLLLVTFYWWFVGNKVKFPRNVGIKLSTVPFSVPCIIDWKRILTTFFFWGVSSVLCGIIQRDNMYISIFSQHNYIFSYVRYNTICFGPLCGPSSGVSGG